MKKAVLLFCIVFLTSRFASGQAPLDYKTRMQIVEKLGLDATETKCLEKIDRNCLIDYYHTKPEGDNPLQAMPNHDSLDWAKVAQIFRDAAFPYSETWPDKSVALYKRAAMFYYMATNIKQCNYAIQNIGFVYEEGLHNYDSSLYFINLALARWTSIRDTLNMANLYKYRAYLSSKTEISTGKQDGHKAITLYKAKNYKHGEMVAYRDLACIFIKEGQTDSANYYLNSAKEFWLEERDKQRVFGVNTGLIDANRNEHKLVKKLIRQNEKTLKADPTISGALLLDYYTAAIFYARNARNSKLEKKYAALKEDYRKSHQ